MADNVNGNAMVPPQIPPENNSQYSEFITDIQYVVVCNAQFFLVFLTSLLYFPHYIHGHYSHQRFAALTLTAVVLAYINIMLTSICLDNTRHQRQQYQAWAPTIRVFVSLSILATGVAYPAFLQTRTMPWQAILVAWVLFVIHILLMGFLNRDWIRKSWFYLGQKAVHPQPSDAVEPPHVVPVQVA